MATASVDNRAEPLPPGTKAPDFSLRSTPDQSLALADLRGRPADPRLLPRGLEPGLLRPAGPLPAATAGVPTLRRPARGHLGRRNLVPPRVCEGPEPALPAAPGLRAQGRGCADVRGIPPSGRDDRAGPVRDRRGGRHSLELRLPGWREPRCGRDPSRARGARRIVRTQWEPVLTMPVSA